MCTSSEASVTSTSVSKADRGSSPFRMVNGQESVASSSVDIGNSSIGSTIQPICRRNPKRSKYEKSKSSKIIRHVVPSAPSFAQLLNCDINAGVAMEVDWANVFDDWDTYNRHDDIKCYDSRNIPLLDLANGDNNNFLPYKSLSAEDDMKVPACGCVSKIDNNSPFDENGENCLPIEVTLNILSYLDLKTLRNVRAVNKTLRNVLQSKDSDAGLWMSLYQTKWPFLQNTLVSNLRLDESIASLVLRKHSRVLSQSRNQYNSEIGDGNDVETAELPDVPFSSKELNHALILSLSSPIPTCIDQNQVILVQKRMQRRRFYQLRSHHEYDEHPSSVIQEGLDNDDVLRPPVRGSQIRRNNNTGSSTYELQFVSVKESATDETTTSPPEVVKGVHYAGPVGEGDRCVRSNHPLPRPFNRVCPSRDVYATVSSSEEDDSDEIDSVARSTAGRTVGVNMLQNLLSRLQRERRNNNMFDADQLNTAHRKRYYHDQLNRVLRVLSKHHISKEGAKMLGTVFKPFVAPFRSNTENEYNVTPRLISYYEVSIHATDKIAISPGSANVDLVNVHHRLSNRWDDNNRFVHSRTECIVVGLATSDFGLLDRMPGWDRNSIGYHGDDGGLFYGTGAMSRRIGPSFGAGDTIGCGIDYSNENEYGGPSVFFTLNGSFLGYEPIRSEYLLNRDLYPVIGIDSNSPITCNFGTSKPFVFDLMALIQNQEKSILEAFPTEMCAN